jgi:hypothetical protein
LLPPLLRVTKRIEAGRGETRIGRLPGLPFHVEGLSLRYPGGVFVDVLSRREDGGYDGAATFFGRRYATFRMRRSPARSISNERASRCSGFLAILNRRLNIDRRP